MANSDSDSENLNPKIDDEQQQQQPPPPSPVRPEEEEADDDEFEEEYEGDSDESPQPQRKRFSDEARLRAEQANLQTLIQRMQTGKVDLRVHDVVINGNTKTKEHLIEDELEGLKAATTTKEVLEVCTVSLANIRELEIFDSVVIDLEAGQHRVLWVKRDLCLNLG